MAKKKQSFFERLTGTINIDDYEDESHEETEETEPASSMLHPYEESRPLEEEEAEGQLSVDVYNTRNDIIIKAMVAGVRSEDLDITITRDMVTIKGRREGDRTVNDEDYYHQELYWGPFSRKIILPEEVDTDEAEAVQREGLLMIKLPKVNKNRETKLKVRSGQ